MSRYSQWDRLTDLVLRKAEKADDPLWACERVFVDALSISNMAIGAAAVHVAASMIAIGRECGVDSEGLLVIHDERMAGIVEPVSYRYQATLPAAEAAMILGYSDRHVRRLVRGGQITGRRTPTGAWQCAAPSVLSYRKRRR